MKIFKMLICAAALMFAPTLVAAEDQVRSDGSFTTSLEGVELTVSDDVAQRLVTNFVKEVSFLSESARHVSLSFTKYCVEQFEQRPCGLAKSKAGSIGDAVNSYMLVLPQKSYEKSCEASHPGLECVLKELARIRNEMLDITTAPSGS